MKKLVHGQPITAGADEATVLFFLDRRDEAVSADPQIGWLEFDPDLRRRLWRKFRSHVLARWTKEYPGTRPSEWWAQDAPKVAVDPDGQIVHGLRKRIGGAGCPAWETHNLVPHTWHGVREDWTDYRDHDAPAYESEAEFLRRQSLLTASERRELSEEDFEPEVMTREDFRHWDSRPWREIVREQILARVSRGEETAERAAKLLAELKQ